MIVLFVVILVKTKVEVFFEVEEPVVGDATLSELHQERSECAELYAVDLV